MSMETYRAMLKRFGASIELADLAPDDEGYCCLSFDELTTHLQYDAEADEVLLFIRLGEIDDDEPTMLYEAMLAANLFWQGTGGATLALQPEDGMVYLNISRPMRVLDVRGFEKLLERFIEAAEHWQEQIEAGAVDEAALAAGSTPDSQADSDLLKV